MNFARFPTAVIAVFSVLFVFTVVPVSAQASEEVDAVEEEFKDDKTGTNPINFTFDARIYNDFQLLNVPGGGHQNLTTFEFRAPFADGKWQFRTRLRASHLNNYGTGVSEFGLGDMDFRLMTVPYANIEKKFAIAVALETFVPIGTDDALSSNALSFGPQVFLGIFGAFGGLVDIFAPGVQHQFSVWQEKGVANIHQTNIDLYFVKTFNDQKQWVLFDPQIILDWKNDREFMIVDAEFGTMLDDVLGTKGHSVWARPSVGLFADRPQDVAVEVGYKVVW